MNISEENRYVIDQFITKLSKIFLGINKYLKDDMPKVELGEVKITYPSSDNIDYYMGKNGTCQCILRFGYYSVLGDKRVKQEPVEIKLPLLIRDIYIYEGKAKLPLNRLVNDSECLISLNRISLDTQRYISVNSGLKIRDFETNKFIPVDYDTVDPENLKLSEYSAKKLAILFELDEIPESLNKDLVDKIRYKLAAEPKLRDNVLNKRVMNSSSALINCLDLSTYSILFELRGKWMNKRRGVNKPLSGYKIYPKSIHNMIRKFFKGNDSYFVGIQDSTGVNPLVFQSMKDKIIFENDTTKTSRIIPFSKYDTSFYGIVDPILTPDNLNTSRINDLVRGVNITRGATYFKCYTPEFEETEVPMIDYINSKVLVSEEVDYDFKEVEAKSKYKVRYRFNLIESDTYDYIELSPDYRLNLATAQVPMINIADSVRVAMGAKMMTQAIGIVGSEHPKVATGNESLLSNPLVISYKGESGIVKSIEEGVITVLGDDDKEYEVKVPDPLRGNNGTNISFSVIPKEGELIKKGSPIIKPSTLDSAMDLSLGINARVAMMTFRGLNYEDGVVISKSFAEKFAHITVKTITLEVTPDMIIEGLAETNDLIKAHGALMVGKKSKSYSSYGRDFRADMGLDTKYSKPFTSYLPNDIDEALVYDIRIAKGKQIAKDETEYFMEGAGRRVAFDLKTILENDNEWRLDGIDLQMIPDFEASPESAYTVKYKLICKHKLHEGDKLTNRYGSKGVVNRIMDDDLMPYDESGRIVDIVMNPQAVISRKNMSQSCEILLTKISKRLCSMNKFLLKDGESALPKVREMLKRYKLAAYYKMSDEELINYHKEHDDYTYTTGAFTKINLPLIIKWLEELHLEEGIQLWDGQTKRKIRNKILVGDMYMLKLYILSSSYAKTTETNIPGFSNLTLGKGSITKGSKFGNMEMDAIQANSISKIVMDAKKDDVMGSSWMLAHAIMSGLIYKLKDDYEEESSNS